jgi:Protein of unknown function (DUF2628)
MRLFTVYLPQNSSAAPHEHALDGAVFVRDGFHFWAFLLGSLWCLWRGLWLPALAILALGAVLAGIGLALQLPPETQILTQLVLALLVGLEAPDLRRFGLRRRGYVERGSVAARDLTDAEAIFFGHAASPQPEPQPGFPPSAPQPGFHRRGLAGEEVVGLFPEYRGR